MTNLEILNAGGDTCGIDNRGIQNLNLRKLYAGNNSKITNVSHMTRLEVLDAIWDCGIDDNGIANCLNLKKLNSYENPKITKKISNS